MKYIITYFLMPDAENIKFTIWAKDYDDACIFAKQYRKDAFMIQEVKEQEKTK